MSVFLAMALGWADAAPSPWFWRPHMTLEANYVPVLWSRPKQKQYLGNVEGALWALGGCLGHAAERQSCLQRDVINYSETVLKGTPCVPAPSLFKRRFIPSFIQLVNGHIHNVNGVRERIYFWYFVCPLMTWNFSGYSIVNMTVVGVSGVSPKVPLVNGETLTSCGVMRIC